MTSFDSKLLSTPGVGELEGIGASVVDDIVSDVEGAARLDIDGFATVALVTAVGKDIVGNDATAAGEVGLVVIVVVEETVDECELAPGVTVMEGGHTAIDGCLEELVLKRDRALCRCGTGIADLCIAEHRLLTVVAADDAAPVVGLARIRLDDNRLVRGTEGRYFRAPRSLWDGLPSAWKQW